MNQHAQPAQVVLQGIYEHYKGKRYQVLQIVRHSEDLGLYVIYQSLYDCPEFGFRAVWCRPLDMFLESVMIDGDMQPRFKLVNKPTA